MYFMFFFYKLNAPKSVCASRARCATARARGGRRGARIPRAARDVPKTDVRLVYFEFDRDTDHRQSCIIERENV